MYVKTMASIGPSSESYEVLEGLIEAGLDIARINFSHAKEEEARARTEKIRKITADKNRNVKILQDLCGRRIRLGRIEGDLRDVATGEELTFYTLSAQAIQPHEIPINDPFLHQDLKPGNSLLIESGKYRLTVTHVDVDSQRIQARVENGGTLESNKGLNIPYVRLTTPALTDKDKQDVELGKELGFEYVALSFVQTKEDVASLRQLLHPNQKIISKVEDPIGLENIDEIIDASDGIMIARGDLGVELPLEEIPLIQKELISKCRYSNKPSIVATQMLLSMVQHPRPTRAEVSDVANAVLDGTDCLMLSDETNIGMYPVESLQTLVRIAERTEKFLYERHNKLD